MSSFQKLGLSDRVLEAVRRLGYAEPTPVQAQTIPAVLSGRDVIAAAKTGTGKTAAFSLPSMDRIGRAAKGSGPLMLVVTPTRELAQQIGDVCAEIALSTRHRILTVVGGLSYNPQINRLKNGVDVLIATPGRLIDLMGRSAVDLSQIEVLVLDEADRMLDMGFLPDIKRIVAALPEKRQTLLLSATIDEAVERSVGSLLHDPVRIEVAQRGDTADTIEQAIVRVAHAAKPAALKALLSSWGADRVIVFARTRGRADACARRLSREGFSVAAIHSDKSQSQRKRALDAFAAGKVGVVVATDVLSRGIDVSGVDYVVNYDMPTQPEDYVHRIGRTGRAGVPGRAVSFVAPENASELKAVEKLTHQRIPEMSISGFHAAQAEFESVSRAQRAAAARDPEIVQATKEIKASKRKAKGKNRARGAAHQAHSTKAPIAETKKSGAAGKGRAGKTSSPASRGAQKSSGRKNASGAQRSLDGRAQTPQKRKAADERASSQKRSDHYSKHKADAGKRSGKTRPKAGSGARKRSGKDMRPGRSHRAALAEQRRRKRM